MGTDEIEILAFLKASPKDYFSAREIGREVGGKRRYAEEPLWAVPVLMRLVNLLLVEADMMGHYRLKPEDKKKVKQRLHVSPQLAAILKKRGGSWTETYVIDEPTEEDEPPAKKSDP